MEATRYGIDPAAAQPRSREAPGIRLHHAAWLLQWDPCTAGSERGAPQRPYPPTCPHCNNATAVPSGGAARRPHIKARVERLHELAKGLLKKINAQKAAGGLLLHLEWEK